MTNVTPGEVVVARGRSFASVSSQALNRRAATFALTVLISLPIGARVKGQEIPGIPATTTEEPPPAHEPTSADEIASRRATVAAELQALDEASKSSHPVNAKHLLAVGARLREISKLLEKQAALASRTAPVEEMPLPSLEAPSAYGLNALYEAEFARGRGDRKPEEFLVASREALAAETTTRPSR